MHLNIPRQLIRCGLQNIIIINFMDTKVCPILGPTADSRAHCKLNEQQRVWGIWFPK